MLIFSNGTISCIILGILMIIFSVLQLKILLIAFVVFSEDFCIVALISLSSKLVQHFSEAKSWPISKLPIAQNNALFLSRFRQYGLLSFIGLK